MKIYKTGKTGRARGTISALLCAALALSLISLPALAAESFSGSSKATKMPETYCGMQQHTHSAACYSTQKILSCALEEGEGHTHTAECYGYAMKLSCTLTEGEGHTHTESCYTTTERLVCGMEEDGNHVHTPECYVQERTLSCTIPEQAPHTHSAECYTADVVYICGLEDDPNHVHTDACISPDSLVLICTQKEQEAHTHTDACYREESVLTCTIPEHKHTSVCYSTNAPMVETEDDWKDSVADAKITGDWRHDFLEVAKTQLGYEPDGTNYITSGGQTLYYTRYGDWYSDDPGLICSEWCATFVSFCLYYAKIDALPFDCGCERWLENLCATDSSLYHPYGDGYVPQPGDIIFITYGRKAFREENEELISCGLEPKDESAMNVYAEHVGILVGMNSLGFRTIEGNNGPVSYHNYSFGVDGQVGDEELILGYYSIPENPHNRTITDCTGNCTINGDFSMDVRPYLREPTFKEYQTFEQSAPGEKLVLGWGVSLTDGEEAITPSGTLHYTFTFDYDFSSAVKVSYLGQSGLETIPCTVEGNKVSFTTDRIGTFFFSQS